jgi:hypothetical protein
MMPVVLKLSYADFKAMQKLHAQLEPLRVVCAQLRFVPADFRGEDVSEGLHGEGRVWAIVDDEADIARMRRECGGPFKGVPTSYHPELRPLLVIHTVS